MNDTQSAPFATLLAHLLAERGGDRKGAAAAFLLRFGRTSKPALLTALTSDSCPSLAAATTYYRFTPDAFVTRIALSAQRSPAPCTRSLTAAVQRARAVLIAQHEPIIDALAHFSRARPRELWGQAAAAIGGQWLALGSWLGSEKRAVRMANHFFTGTDQIAAQRPRFLPSATRRNLYAIQRSTCCRYYRAPNGHYCDSCPIAARNRPAAVTPATGLPAVL